MKYLICYLLAPESPRYRLKLKELIKYFILHTEGDLFLLKFKVSLDSAEWKRSHRVMERYSEVCSRQSIANLIFENYLVALVINY